MDKDTLLELIHTTEMINNETVLRFMKRFDGKLNISQIMVLYLLRKNGAAMPSKISKSLGYTTGAMTGISDRLIKDGYVVKKTSPEDRRAVLLDITDSGIKLLDDAREHGQKISEEIFSILTEEEIRQYTEIQKKILDYYEANE